MWLLLGCSALLSRGKTHWWDQQPSDKAGDSWVTIELPCATSRAWGSSQGPVQHKAQLDPRRASVSSQVCGRPFTARDCSQWIVPALLQSVWWRNRPLNPCQFSGNGSEMIKKKKPLSKGWNGNNVGISLALLQVCHLAKKAPCLMNCKSRLQNN